jgi:spectinomycin phosphotransferase
MLEKPDLQDEKILACLQGEYGMLAVQLAFLPLGADRDTAVYRAVADDGTPYAAPFTLSIGTIQSRHPKNEI